MPRKGGRPKTAAQAAKSLLRKTTQIVSKEITTQKHAAGQKPASVCTRE